MKFLGLGGRSASVGRDGLPREGKLLPKILGFTDRQKRLAGLRKRQYYESARAIRKSVNQQRKELRKNSSLQEAKVYKRINNPNPGRSELQLFAEYGVKPSKVYSHPEWARDKVIKGLEKERRQAMRELSAQGRSQRHEASRRAAQQVREQLQTNNDQAA